MRRIIQNGDGEAQGSCGANLPAVSRSAAGEPVVLIQSQAGNRRRLDGLESAIETDEESFQSIGSIAVRLVANFRLPSCKLLRLDQRGK